jgi:cytochrome P450
MSDHFQIDLDHWSAEHAADPYASLGAIRDRCPFAHSSTHGGFWIASDWEHVVRVASDAVTFSALKPDGISATHIPNERSPVIMAPLEIDPPDYVPYRRLVEPHMSPSATELMEAGIHYWVDLFIDRVIESGSMNVPTEYGTPVPSSITIDWIGLPAEDWRFYWSARHNPDPVQKRQDFDQLLVHLREEILARREAPRGDLLSVIANAVIDGEPIDVGIAIGLTEFLIAGGTETTGDLFATAILHMAENPAVHRRLIEDDRFMRTATEEYLRMTTPTMANGRFAKCPVEVDGHLVEAGDQIMLAWAAANRDPKVFENPEATDLERWPNRHLAFGVGPHRCLGSNLGRAMFRIMTRRLLQRMPDFRVVEAVPMSPRPMFAGYATLRIEFTPAERVLPEGPPKPQFETAYAA